MVDLIALKKALDVLNHRDDAHWTKSGQPNLNVLTEALGTRVTREDLMALEPSGVTLNRDDGMATGSVAEPDDAPDVEPEEEKPSRSETVADTLPTDERLNTDGGGQWISLGAGKRVRVSQS